MYIIIGGSGFLGHYIIQHILNKTNEKIIATYTKDFPRQNNSRIEWLKFDVSNNDSILSLNNYVKENAKVIYLASCHNPDFIEKNSEFAWDINITSLSNFINKFKKVSCLYYASTDVIYGESINMYKFKETDIYNPINLYGEHKVLAERLILSKNYNIFRFPLMMGRSLNDDKKHFYDQIVLNLKSNKIIDMFYDSYRSTLSFKQCAKYVIDIIENYNNCNEKIINIASDTPISKYDLGLKIADFYSLNKNLIRPISIKSPHNIFQAKRAVSTIMDNTKLKKLLNIEKIELEF